MMNEFERDRLVIEAIQRGLPLVPRPYAGIGARIGLAEEEVIARIRRMQQDGTIKRFGVIVRHHELGYSANAMVVWDVPDAQVADIGQRLSAFDFISLCYRRARAQPEWPYNLYCMIHGRDRAAVRRRIAYLTEVCGLQEMRHAVLFSRRRYKQRGALYQRPVRDNMQPLDKRCAAAG